MKPRNKNIEININKISKALNIPVVATVATKSEGIKELIKEAIKIGDAKENNVYKIDYGKDIEKEIKLLQEAFSECAVNFGISRINGQHLKLLENDEYIKKYIDGKENCEKINNKLEKSIENLIVKIGYEPDAFIIDKRYEVISEIIQR